MTLGKFAPLHRGHQHVIETALAEMDHVVVVIYDACEVTSVPLPVRARWIRQLYPEVEIIEAWDGPSTVSDDPRTTRIHDAYLTRLLAGRTITHFYSSEFYGDHVSRALGAIDRRVDPNRSVVPISGSVIREQPFRCRQYLEPLVYRDLVTKVVLLGAPSTGKSTLAEGLASRYDTEWMPEYGREYWDAHQSDRRLTLEQLVEIAREHRRREDELVQKANRYLFVDTDATTTLQFSMYYHGRAADELQRLADQTRDRYDVFLLCQPDIPYDDTADRSGSAQRELFHRQISADLMARRIPFVRIGGTQEQRIERVADILRIGTPYEPLSDSLAFRLWNS
jgi:HTH-type transcriptional regulator, transcriptional repressor of NAD biosynthesis genes